jgi:hypothetical protein
MIRALFLAGAALGLTASGAQAQPLTVQQYKGVAGARMVAQRWADALERRDFEAAWAQFRHPPASRAAFVRWWGRYRTIHVALDRESSDAGAGSLYYTVRATLTGVTRGGKAYRLQGPVVLRRANDIDGASPQQLRWHIETADLKAVGG